MKSVWFWDAGIRCCSDGQWQKTGEFFWTVHVNLFWYWPRRKDPTWKWTKHVSFKTMMILRWVLTSKLSYGCLFWTDIRDTDAGSPSESLNIYNVSIHGRFYWVCALCPHLLMCFLALHSATASPLQSGRTESQRWVVLMEVRVMLTLSLSDSSSSSRCKKQD